MFIPPSVEIVNNVFTFCTNTRFLMLPQNIQRNIIGKYTHVFAGCEALSDSPDALSGNEINHRYDHLPFLRVCNDPNVTVSMIQKIRKEHGTIAFHKTDDKFGLTPLHGVTSVDTFADKDVIIACFDASPSAL